VISRAEAPDIAANSPKLKRNLSDRFIFIRLVSG
jgi:hypothetical protein